ncbi:MAG: branched-chain amino acid transport system II carrier protein [Anaerovoracaceae bacterium]
MQNRNRRADIMISGFAMFAMFFGAGNLIFPPYLGVLAGSNWLDAMIGFLVTDPVLPILGVIATAMVGGKANDLGERAGHTFSKVLALACILTIGPAFAVPRTSSTTHEIATMQLFPDAPAWTTAIVFFAITLLLTLNPSKVVDIIGKYLTPALLIILIGTIIACIIKPIGEIRPTEDTGFFVLGFKEGYNTMDGLGAALTAGIFVTDFVRKGYTNKKERFNVTVKAGIVCFVLLAVAYGGLTYVGATASQVFAPDAARSAILIGVFDGVFGVVGKVGIGIAVAAACLTTSIGLTGMAGNYISGMTHDKVPYKVVVTACVVCSTIVACVVPNLDALIFKAVPVLSVLFPCVIVLVIMTFLGRWIRYNWAFTGAMIGTLLISIPESINLYMNMNGIDSSSLAGIMGMIGKLPLAQHGFAYVSVALVGAILGYIVQMIAKTGKTIDDMEPVPEEMTIEEFLAR